VEQRAAQYATVKNSLISHISETSRVQSAQQSIICF